MFSVRIVSTDHYMAPPIKGLDVQYADQRGSEVKKVPVVRIFGSTPAGQKTCMHVHGVFPYLYVPYDGTVPWDRYLRQFATSLDKAINVAQGHGQSSLQHIYKVVLVTGRSMYGYHEKEQQFLKIYFYNPSMVKKAADLLLGGAVLNKPFQPHEAHIPYTLQLFIDYNLYGMNLINVAAVKFRKNSQNVDNAEIPLSQGSDEGIGSDPKTPSTPFTALLNRSGSTTPSQKIWQRENIPRELYLDDNVEKLSTCELEVDIVAADILNRLEVGANIGTNPGLTALWEDERQRRRDRGDTGNIAPPQSQERSDVEVAESELMLRERLQQILQDLQPYMDSQADTDSEQSQDFDFPLTQASELDLHLSQDTGQSPDIDMLNAEHLEGDNPVVDIQSIQRVVSFSQSFCDVRPELHKISSQDKSLVDILASLADDSSTPASQLSAVELVAMEEQDSILSQTTPVVSQEAEEEDEILEMSHQIWEGENKPAAADDDNYDLEGLDDTWVDSQPEPDRLPAAPDTTVVTTTADDSDSDSDTSDILPQYDGPPDEKGDAKQATVKRLGMRGPASNWSNRVSMPLDTGQNVVAANPFADTPSTNQNFINYPNNQIPRFPGNWNHQGNHNWSQPIHRLPGAPQQHHLPGFQHSSQLSPPPRTQYNPRATLPPHGNPSVMIPSYSMASRNQNLPHPYGGTAVTGNQQLSPHQVHGHIQGQLSPGSYPGSQSFNNSTSQQMSPPYVAQPHHAQSSQSNMPYSPHNFTSQGSPGRYSQHPVSYSEHSPNTYSRSNMKMDVYSTKRSEIINQSQAEFELPELNSYSELSETQEFGSAYSRSNPLSTSSPAMNSMPNMQSSFPARSNQMMSQLSPNSEPLSSQNVRNSSARASSAQVSDSDSSVPMYTAQPLSAVLTSQPQRSFKEKGNQGSETVFKKKSSAMMSNRFMSNLLEKECAKSNAKLDLSGKQLPYAQKKSGTSPPTQDGDVVSFLSNAFFEHQEKCVEVSSRRGSEVSNFDQPAIRRHNSLEGLYRGDTNDSSPRSVSLQHSPRTPASDTSIQSPESVSSKHSEPFIGPITKYYTQKRILYEQISPPVTPVNTSAGEFMRKPLSTSSTGSKFSEQQISPLQKLLLDHSDIPLTGQSDGRPGSLSRSSISSPSSVGSDRHSLSQQDLFPSSAKNTENKSRLYNLLAQTSAECREKKELEDVNKNSNQCLNDSQQDLFADSLLSDSGNRDTAATDSLSSLFGDENFENSRSRAQNSVPIKDDFASLSSLENFVGSVRNESAEFGVNFDKTSVESRTIERKDTFVKSIPASRPAVQQTSERLPSSVSVSRPLSYSQETMRGQQFQSSEIPLSQSQSTDMSFYHGRGGDVNIGQSSGRGIPASRGRGRAVLHGSNPNGNYNVSHWPEYNQPKIGRGNTSARGMSPKRRGRPPGSKNSTLHADINALGILQKKKRGRPKKQGDVNDSNLMLPNYTAHGFHDNTLQRPRLEFQQQFQNNFPMHQGSEVSRNVIAPSVNLNMPYAASQQTSFSQLLEGTEDDLFTDFPCETSKIQENNQPVNLFESNAIVQQEPVPVQNQFSCEMNVNQEMNFNQNNIFQRQFSSSAMNVSNHLNMNPVFQDNPRNSSLPMATGPFEPSDGMTQPFENSQFQYNQQYQPPHYQHQEQQQQREMEQQPLSTIGLCEAMQISEPGADMNQVVTTSSDDLAQFLQEYDSNTQHSQSFNACDSARKIQYAESIKKLNMENMAKKLAKQHQDALFDKVTKGTVSDMAAVMQLIRYRPKSGSPQKSSPAYTFRFQVPTPVYKRLKLRVKSTSDDPEFNQIDFVRMHPKDARKYSLLKIGREVIRLHKLSVEQQNEIKETVKAGVKVDSIPPPVRQVVFADIPQSSSIIADLLSAESPESDEMIGTSEVENALLGSMPSDMLQTGDAGAFMTKTDEKPMFKDKKSNSMFRGRNIANIPHLKKYRAGFPYFGKGNIGKSGGPLKMRPNNRGLKPEYEDDQNIVLKDVSLTEASDGTLTPIKSRTPIAGRSPAHSSVGNVSEIENKTLESKLKGLDYELDLNQSGNSQMFQDMLIEEKELQQKQEFENTLEEFDSKTKAMEECESNEMAVVGFDGDNLLSPTDSVILSDVEYGDNSPHAIGSLETENVNENLNVQNENVIENSKYAKDKIDEKIFNRNNAYDNIKAKLKQGEHNDKSHENGYINPYTDNVFLGKQSRSSSRDSRSRSTSRRNSAIVNDDDTSVMSASAAVTKHRQSTDGSDSSKSVSKRTKRSNGSSSGGSRRSSRSSSLDFDGGKKRKSKKAKKHDYRYDSDSDGIPGVDYIVVNKFKGRKELRVVVDKLVVDDEVSLSLKSSDKKLNGIHSHKKTEVGKSVPVTNVNSNDFVKKDASSSNAFTGYSAEFMKFLASQSKQSAPSSTLDLEDGDSQDSMQCSDDCKQVVNTVRSHTTRNSAQLTFKEDGSSINEEGVNNKDLEPREEKLDEAGKRRNGRAAVNIEGMGDFSSSSDDEDINKNNRRRLEKPQHSNKLDSKKKRAAKSIHDGSVFCSKTRRKKSKLKKTPTKLMNTLSVLHDATMEKLTTFQSFSDIEAGNSSSNQSSSRSRDVSDVDSPAKWQPRTKTPDFELYCDRANDYVSSFEDTMYKLAYLSPMSSPSCSDSPPRPLSPKEFRKLEITNEHLNHKQVENGEKKMTISDILKVMQSEAESVKECEVNKKETPDTPSKIAVARTETLTFKDIQSFCLAEKDTEEKQAVKNKMELEGKMECRDESDKSVIEKLVESPPPDLGPPVLETMGSQPEENSPPPHLSPNRSEMISELSIGRRRDPLRIEKGHNAPPFLTPCRSPRVMQSPKGYVSPRCSRAPDGTENGDYFGLLVEKEVAKPGRSPGACSSSGSINVIHSEEFSDISDENDSEDEALCSKSKQIKLQKPRYANSPTMASLSSKTAPVCSISENRNTYISDIDIERKKKEIKEFEERHKKHDEVNMNKPTDLKGNNIFDMFSSKNSVPVNLSQSPRQNSSDTNHFGLRGNGGELGHFTDRFNRSLSSELLTSSNAFQPREYAGNRQKKLECMFQPGSAAKLFQSMSSGCTSGNSMPRNGISKQNRSDSNFNGSLENDYMKQFTNKQFLNMDLDISGEQFAQNSMFVNPKTSTGHQRLSHQSETRLRRQVSGDLFDSLTSESSITSESRSVHSLHRSLSDNSRLDYSIVPNNKLNNSIMRSLQNYSNRETLRPDNDLNSMVPMIEFGGGSGRRGQRTGQWNQNQGTDSQGTQPSSLTLTSSGNYGQSLSGSQVQRGGQGHNTQIPTSGYPGCQVITPHTGPPLLESILASANQHGLAAYRSTGAFYSNYGDMPDKPREGGGHVIKLPSTLVKDLEEFEPFSSSSSSSLSSNVTGIKNWRTILTANDPLCSTQTGSENLCDKLDSEPALKYALTGDQSVIITPCNLPPSRKAVEIWYQGRKVYKNLKNKALQEDILKKDKTESKTKDKDNEKSEVNREKPEKSKPRSDMKIVIDESVKSKELDSEKYRLNLFTGKRELASDADFTTIIEKSEEKRSSVREITDAASINADTSIQELKSNFKDREEIESPKSSQESTDNMLHSTPVLRHGSTELFETECTPITGEKRPSQEDHPPGFVTPKRIRPLRRLSTNTDTALRRAILSYQIKQQFGTPAILRADTSQIEGPSLKNSFGFKHSQQNLQDSKALHEYQYLTVLSVEVHVETRGDLRPDPEVDGIQVIFYSIFNDIPADGGTRQETGAFIVDPVSANSRKDDKLSSNQKHPYISVSHDPQPGTSKAADLKPAVAPSTSKDLPDGTKPCSNLQETLLQKSGIPGLNVTYVRDEKDLLETFVDFVHRWDPDILVGFEIQMLSWGYILQRASVLSMNLAQAISRVPSAKDSSHHSKEQDEYGADHMSEIHIAGRIVLNLWRLLRHEVTLNVYSFENIAFHVLHRRVPLFSFRSLTAWFKHRTHLHRWKVIEHYVTRVKGSLEVMDQLDMLGRTSEFARVFGIEFYHVMSRGSQYRVESMMLRIAKPMNYIPVSPSVHQRARMKAPECIALTLEPESKFYTDPVLVLDFQSLYPSIMIAYNYCFSTCLGRLEWFQKAHEGPIEFGCTSLGLHPSVIRKLSNEVTVSPNGVVFCKQSVKRGVIPIMVEEILNTRLMVKKAMSSYKDDKTLSRMLNARQLGLKLIANVTYGYTGANFSGRMPCIEVGDSIVRKARETLERSIKLVEDTPAWGAKVVYGGTDSMFVLLKGRSKDEAFKIGYDIAKKVTAMFPKPITLKFEKVYLPCVLQTKKRYVGFMYETPDQKEPVYDAKGIETVRRDTCSAVAKILERSLKVLFTSKDVSEVKSYIQQQCQKVMEGNVSLQDFVFAKEYRGIPGYKPGACVPALEIAKKQLRQDRRSEPRVGERVPYVIVYGSPGLPLIQLVRQPHEILQDPSLRLNATYYITKQILPPLDRFLSLMGANVFSWYQEMPHSAGRAITHHVGTDQAKKGTISQYFATSNCPTCDSQTKRPVCEQCMLDPQAVCVTLNDRISRWEMVQQKLYQICGACIGTSENSTVTACLSLDCPVQFRRVRASNDLSMAQTYREILAKVFK